jgi:hypothetical protein
MAPPKLKIVDPTEVSEIAEPAETELDMPKTLKIGPFIWRVIEMEELEVAQTNNIGYCDPSELTIAVSPRIHPQRQGEVMLHELIHACFRTGDLNIEDEKIDEEKIVSVLGIQMIQIMRDNPEVFRWIDQKIRTY